MSEHKDAFNISAEYVNERVVLRSEEVVWGVVNGWISARDAIRVCAYAWNVHGTVDPVVERIGSLLGDEEETVSEIVEAVEVSGEWVSFESRVWLFLAVANLRDRWDSIAEPNRRLESIFADFEYPAEMEPFIGFMPYEGPGGPPAGLVMARLGEYVEEKTALYRNRLPGE